MLFATIFGFLLTAGYVALMVMYRVGWKRQSEFIVPALYEPSTRISIVIPARNEAANISTCIESILAQKYPEQLFEVIVVDDHSDDDTVRIVEEYTHKNVRCIRLADNMPAEGESNSFKKAAITAGIAYSHGELIATTDADCIAPNTWLRHVAALYEQASPAMIVAPVVYRSKRSILQLLQAIDFIGMQGITAAAHFLNMGNMCNGANLIFKKTVFDGIGGYNGIRDLASGDDYLLMMKIAKSGAGDIKYLKSANAAVTTFPQQDWKHFLQQRIRWASKSGKYDDKKLTAILVLVYLFNLMLISLAVASLFNSNFLFFTTAFFCAKVVIEYYFLMPVTHFFHSDWVMWYFPFLQPVHIVYVVVAGFLGFFGGYEWKGRRVR